MRNGDHLVKGGRGGTVGQRELRKKPAVCLFIIQHDGIPAIGIVGHAGPYRAAGQRAQDAIPALVVYGIGTVDHLEEVVQPDFAMGIGRNGATDVGHPFKILNGGIGGKPAVLVLQTRISDDSLAVLLTLVVKLVNIIFNYAVFPAGIELCGGRFHHVAQRRGDIKINCMVHPGFHDGLLRMAGIHREKQ